MPLRTATANPPLSAQEDMKTLILILTLAAAASAQILCSDMEGRPVLPVNKTINLNNGSYYHVDIMMPVDGRCVGAFTAYDASDDLNSTAANVLSRYVDRPKGDIEVLIMDYVQFTQWVNGRSNIPLYSSRPQLSGRFAVDLPRGNYKLIVSNKHSKLAPKTVDLMIGWPSKRSPEKPNGKKYRAP